MNTDFMKGVIVPILTPIDENEWIDEKGDSLKGTTKLSTKAYLPLKLTGLASGTTYSITVTAYFNENSSTSQTVGNTIFKTLSN